MENSSDIVVRANELVKNVIETAQTIVGCRPVDQGALSDYKMKNIDWVTCKDFTVDIGKKQIEEYISTWEIDSSWLYSLVFVHEIELEYHKQYNYRAQWSVPTRRTPIPRGTACVFFVIEISKIKPQTLPVEVYFFVESNRLIHRPGKTRFREKWLKDVIESKAFLQDTVKF
ncbi:A-kinase anchor protein 14 [Alosa pseudoharengus]|uniref:A-kinase anchor protein 14 n=1 Tax=Alosa pseudoharengus TaxID=34774 RepID=UPI003F8B03AD